MYFAFLEEAVGIELISKDLFKRQQDRFYLLPRDYPLRFLLDKIIDFVVGGLFELLSQKVLLQLSPACRNVYKIISIDLQAARSYLKALSAILLHYSYKHRVYRKVGALQLLLARQEGLIEALLYSIPGISNKVDYTLASLYLLLLLLSSLLQSYTSSCQYRRMFYYYTSSTLIAYQSRLLLKYGIESLHYILPQSQVALQLLRSFILLRYQRALLATRRINYRQQFFLSSAPSANKVLVFVRYTTFTPELSRSSLLTYIIYRRYTLQLSQQLQSSFQKGRESSYLGTQRVFKRLAQVQQRPFPLRGYPRALTLVGRRFIYSL